MAIKMINLRRMRGMERVAPVTEKSVVGLKFGLLTASLNAR